MEISRIVAGEYRCNNYVVSCNGKAILIDASLEVDKLENVLKKNNATLEAVFITHSHFDHILNLDKIIEKFNVSIYISESGKENVKDPHKNVSEITDSPFGIKHADNLKVLKDGESLEVLGGLKIKVVESKGHCDSSLCYILGDIMFTGDTLFAGTYGRVDLWNSSLQDMAKSLAKLYKIGGMTTYYPGHGYSFDSENMKSTISNCLKDGLN